MDTSSLGCRVLLGTVVWSDGVRSTVASTVPSISHGKGCRRLITVEASWRVMVGEATTCPPGFPNIVDYLPKVLRCLVQR